MTKLEKKAWLNDIPKLIYKLKKNYNFYYSGFVCRITKDILEVIKNKKHKHKIILYRHNQRFFIVVYRKDDCVIYFTNEYINDTKYNRIHYFVQKFNKAYDKATKELENDFFKGNSSE